MGEKSIVVKRNNFIDLLRFLLCLIIFLHHSGHVNVGGKAIFPSGGLAADTFFMLTGYYAVRHLSGIVLRKEMPKSPFVYAVKYTVKKLVRVFPYAAFGTVIVYILDYVVSVRNGISLSAADMLYMLKTLLIEICFLPLTGLMSLDLLTYRNAPMWYLSAMLFALPVLMWLGLRLYKIFKYILVWAIPLGIQILFLLKYGGILPWQDYIGFINTGIMRGLSGMMLGGAIYFVSCRVVSGCFVHPLSRESATLFTVAEAVLLGLFMAAVIMGVHGMGEMVALYVMVIALVLIYSKITFFSGINIKAAGILGSLSMPIFCIHWGIYRWVGAFWGYLDYRIAIILTFILCLITAIILKAVFTKLSSLSKRHNPDPS